MTGALYLHHMTPLTPRHRPRRATLLPLVAAAASIIAASCGGGSDTTAATDSTAPTIITPATTPATTPAITPATTPATAPAVDPPATTNEEPAATVTDASPADDVAITLTDDQLDSGDSALDGTVRWTAPLSSREGAQRDIQLLSTIGRQALFQRLVSNPGQGAPIVEITALDVDTGGVAWITDAEMRFDDKPFEMVDGVIVMKTPTDPASLVGIEVDNGEELWRFPIDFASWNIVDDKLIVFGPDEILVADAATGASLWTTGDRARLVALSSNGFIAAQNSSSLLVGYDWNDGEQWRRELTEPVGPQGDRRPATGSEVISMVIGNDVVGISVADGNEVWRAEELGLDALNNTDSSLTSLTPSTVLTCSDVDGGLVLAVLDTSTGEQQWAQLVSNDGSARAELGLAGPGTVAIAYGSVVTNAGCEAGFAREFSAYESLDPTTGAVAWNIESVDSRLNYGRPTDASTRPVSLRDDAEPWTFVSLDDGGVIATGTRFDAALPFALGGSIVHLGLLDEFELLDQAGTALLRLDTDAAVAGWTPDRLYLATSSAQVLAVD